LHSFFREKRNDLLATATLFSLVVAVGTAGKELAADYYFVAPALYASLALVRAIPSPEKPLLALLSLAQVCGVAAVLLGFQGRATPQVDRRLEVLRPALIRLGKPALVTLEAGNLPWFQPRPPYFLAGAGYFRERELGFSFSEGGIAGMIRSRRIGVVVCPKEEPCGIFDGVDLDKLRIIEEDSYWRYLTTEP
jgi:hypothetical protein